MSAKKLAIVLLSSFLILSAAPAASTQSKYKQESNTSAPPGEVIQVQQGLIALMYNPGEPNGMMTPKTRQAIREFQYLNNLPVTGELDEQTKIAVNTQGTGSVQTSEFKQSSYSTVKREKPSKPDSDLAKRVSKAADVLQDLTAAADKRIPGELLERAEAIAVIPNMIKGAFGIGGRYGKGVVSQRLENGRWSPPAFVEIGGGSFGAQLGVSSTDLVLVFTDRKALDLLKRGKDLKLGVDASAVAGPVGRSAEAGINLKLDSAIYAYSRAKGLFVGVALDGAVLNIEDHDNAKVYGPSATLNDILNGKTAMNSTVRPFVDVLDKVVPKKRISQK